MEISLVHHYLCGIKHESGGPFFLTPESIIEAIRLLMSVNVTKMPVEIPNDVDSNTIIFYFSSINLYLYVNRQGLLHNFNGPAKGLMFMDPDKNIKTEYYLYGLKKSAATFKKQSRKAKLAHHKNRIFKEAGTYVLPTRRTLTSP